MSKKQFLIVVIIAFLVGSLGSILFNRFIIPYLATLPGLSSLRSLQTNSPIVINRREQIQIDDGVNAVELTKQAQSFTVSVYGGTGDSLKLLGTGIVLTSDGVIFTSRSAIGDLKEVTVVLNDGRSYQGLVRALDRKSELVIVTISSNNLNVAQFDDPMALSTGQRIITLGKTTGEFTRQFASGVVTRTVGNFSSLEQVYSTETLSETFTTNAGINQDFLGGPVINLEGRVIGMVADSSGRIITSDGLNKALNNYLVTGKILRPYLGVSYLSFSKTLAMLKNYDQPGVLIVSVQDDSPAKAAGLKVGDYVTAVDGTKMDSTTFERLINRRDPGNVELTLFRDNAETKISFNMETR